MGWLIGPTLASMVAAFIIGKIFDYLFAGIAGSVVNTARAGVVAVAWTAVTAGSGMHSVTKLARRLRQGNADAGVRLDALTKGAPHKGERP